MPWLHTVIADCNLPGYVVHHINGVSVDNRRKNLHILPKREHDSINHPGLKERKEMFANPAEYWKKRKNLAIDKFIIQLSLIITDEARSNFIAKFAEENLDLTKKILEAARFYLNLRSIKSTDSQNRSLNPHLSSDYIDAYELERFLLKNTPKSSENQLRLF